MSAEVPPRLVRSLLLSMEAAGHDAVGLARSVDLTGGAARAAPEWDVLAQLLEEFYGGHGAADTQRLVERWVTSMSAVRAVTELLGAPLFTYRLLLHGLACQAPLDVSSQALEGGRLRVTLELHRGLRPSLVLFHVCWWALAAVPRARGLPASAMAIREVGDGRLDCVITPPPPGGLCLDYADASLRVLAARLFGGGEPRHPEVPSVQVLQQRFGLTRAEARVVRRLALGTSISRIAQELNVSDATARTHAKRAMQKTDTHRQAELVSLVLSVQR